MGLWEGSSQSKRHASVFGGNSQLHAAMDGEAANKQTTVVMGETDKVRTRKDKKGYSVALVSSRRTGGKVT